MDTIIRNTAIRAYVQTEEASWATTILLQRECTALNLKTNPPYSYAGQARNHPYSYNFILRK